MRKYEMEIQNVFALETINKKSEQSYLTFAFEFIILGGFDLNLIS